MNPVKGCFHGTFNGRFWDLLDCVHKRWIDMEKNVIVFIISTAQFSRNVSNCSIESLSLRSLCLCTIPVSLPQWEFLLILFIPDINDYVLVDFFIRIVTSSSVHTDFHPIPDSILTP